MYLEVYVCSLNTYFNIFPLSVENIIHDERRDAHMKSKRNILQKCSGGLCEREQKGHVIIHQHTHNIYICVLLHK